MDFKTRITTIEDLDRLCEIEISAMPGSPPYVEDNAKYFFEEAPGVIYGVENDDGLLVGMGRYSRLPDGSGWLETLRVHEEWQGMGAGKLVYGEYFKKAKEENASVIRMYTEEYNVVSKTLAESLGFVLAAEYGNKKISLDKADEENYSFKLVESIDEIDWKKIKSSWGKFISINRTFFEVNEENLKWMIQEKMVYALGDNLIVLGARMLKERGLFLSLVIGDYKKCIDFAMAEAKRQGYNTLTTIYPIELKEYDNVLNELGFEEIYNLFTMEKTF